ncbi:MAG: phytanoyl-CoA dioxygenase family protein [Propylenella sp.]
MREQIEASGPIGRLAAALCGREMRPVRVLLFDKTPVANWAVPWHQDRTIAVKRRAEVAGYGPWTIKEGAVHVEPPVAVLNDMLTLRAFLDDCGADDGALEVVVGSHLFGRVPGGEIKELVNRARVFVGIGRSGDVLAMRTLGIHRSKRAATPTHRRVVHVDYSSFHLPAPLQWRLV